VKPTKPKVYRFLIVTVIIIIVCFGLFQTISFKEHFRAYKWEANRLSNQNLQVYSELKDLNKNDYVQFENVEGFKSNKTYNYARVVRITKDSASIKPFLFMNGIKLKDIDNYYDSEKDKLKEVKLSFEDLKYGICDSYLPFIGFKFCGLQLLNSEEKLRLSSINNSNEPIIRFSDIDINESGKFYISMYNVGQEIYMQNIKASQDSIRFFQKFKFPYLIGKKDSRNSHFAVAGVGWNQSEDAEIEFTVVTDTLSTKFYCYRLSALGEFTRKFERIN
jgi:hypothetical protein